MGTVGPLALSLASAGPLEESLARFHEALALDSGDRELILACARVESLRGRYAQARRRLHAAYLAAPHATLAFELAAAAMTAIDPVALRKWAATTERLAAPSGEAPARNAAPAHAAPASAGLAAPAHAAPGLAAPAHAAPGLAGPAHAGRRGLAAPAHAAPGLAAPAHAAPGLAAPAHAAPGLAAPAHASPALAAPAHASPALAGPAHAPPALVPPAHPRPAALSDALVAAARVFAALADAWEGERAGGADLLAPLDALNDDVIGAHRRCCCTPHAR